jgi:hypothetical protein
LQNEKIAESFGWGKGESYDDCICCSAFNLHDFAEAIRFDERERLVGKTQEPEPDKSSLFSYKTLIAYAASCVAEALSDIRQQSQLEAKDEPVAWMYEVNHAHTCLDLFEPPDDAYDEGTLYPLYTTPPRRTWVALTDKEILVKCESVPDYDIGNHDLIQFARAIEAKLRSKND